MKSWDGSLLTARTNRSAVHTSTPNKFVATSLEYGLTYLAHCVGVSLGDFKVTILADNDYYSQTSASTRTGFATFSTTIQDTHKTGLGSSAALVTALVATLLGFFSPISYRQDIKVIHNLAQAAHCAAQGKVGSGFDVAAAVYGSCLYRRFSPSILESLGESSTAGFGARLHRCVEDRDEAHPWDVEISDTAVDIPESLLVRMCDVDCGSETPSMVRKVLTWRKENPLECQLLWAALQRAQDDLIRELKRLSAHSGLRMEDQDLLHDIIKTMRSLVREMTEKSSVPIEPPAITELLNYCTSLPGVIGGVAPGAGGYDAIALLIRNDVEVLRDLNNRLEHWTQSSPNDIVTVGRARLLSAHQAYEGLQVEDPSRYDDWVR